MRVPFSAIAALLSISSLANGQTSTSCDPTKTSCPADPALGKTLTTDFTQGTTDDWTYVPGSEGLVTFNSSGANFVITEKNQAPTMISEKYIFFGKVSATIKASHGTGIVSAFILLSDDLDEIDWEWLGGSDSSVQTNIFRQGNDGGVNLATINPNTANQEEWHTYTLDWTSTALTWYIDNVAIRTVHYSDFAGTTNRYPQTPMRVHMGNWIGCPDAAAAANPATSGRCAWAGGPADWSTAPYNMQIKSVTIEDYGCASEYVYGDKSGTWQSIQSVGTCGQNAASSTTTSMHSSTTTTHQSTTAAHESTTATHESTTATHESTTATHESTTATHESTTAAQESTTTAQESTTTAQESTTTTHESATATQESTTTAQESTTTAQESTTATQESTPTTRQGTASTTTDGNTSITTSTQYSTNPSDTSKSSDITYSTKASETSKPSENHPATTTPCTKPSYTATSLPYSNTIVSAESNTLLTTYPTSTQSEIPPSTSETQSSDSDTWTVGGSGHYATSGSESYVVSTVTSTYTSIQSQTLTTFVNTAGATETTPTVPETTTITTTTTVTSTVELVLSTPTDTAFSSGTTPTLASSTVSPLLINPTDTGSLPTGTGSGTPTTFSYSTTSTTSTGPASSSATVPPIVKAGGAPQLHGSTTLSFNALAFFLAVAYVMA